MFKFLNDEVHATKCSVIGNEPLMSVQTVFDRFFKKDVEEYSGCSFGHLMINDKFTCSKKAVISFIAAGIAYPVYQRPTPSGFAAYLI